MKKVLFAAFVLLCMVGTTLAQGPARGGQPMNPEQYAKHRTERLTKQLELTPQQATAVEALYVKQGEQMQQMRKVQQGDRAAMREKMVEARKAREAEFKKIMTKEQYEKWQQLQAEQPHHGRQGAPQGGRRGGHARPHHQQ